MFFFRAGKQKLIANVVLVKEKVHVIYTVYFTFIKIFFFSEKLLLLRIKSVLPTTVIHLFLRKINK